MISDAPEFLLRCAAEKGPLFRAKMGAGSMLVVAHPDDLREILQDNAKMFVRGASLDLIRPMLGNGLPMTDGDFWLKQRRTMQPVFNKGHVGLMANGMIRVVDKHLRQLRVGDREDIHRRMTNLTRDVIVETMFSDSLGANTAHIDQALTVIGQYVARYSFLPVRIPMHWPLPDNIRFRKAIATLDRLVYGLIDRRRAAKPTMDQAAGDLLDALLAARDPETGEQMSEKQLRDEVLTIFFAGHETTANALTWTLIELSKNPEWGDKMRAEVLAVLGSRPPTVQDVMALPVTNAVLREAMRLHPPAWIFARVAQQDTLLRGFEIRRGQTVLLSPYVTHRLKEYWPDADRFDPNRFLNDNPYSLGGSKQPHYLPFGAGPHVCIGNYFAVTEAVLALVAIARHSRWVLTKPNAVRTKVGTTLGASHTDATLRAWSA
jgi:cytochrome P450